MSWSPPPDPWLRAHARHHHVDVGQVSLHVVEAGAGPTVLLLHGFPDFWYVWRHQIRALADAGFRVLAPDMRGFNLSGKPPGVANYRLSVLAADVEAVAARFDVEAATLVMHDWGAVVGWHLAMTHPAWLRRLVVINTPHPERFLRGLRTIDQLRRSWYIFYFQLPWLPERQLAWGHAATLRGILAHDPQRPGAFSPADIEYCVEAQLQPGALRGAMNCYRAAFRQGPRRFAGSSSPVQTPTLVLWGDADRYLGPSLAEPSAHLVPTCTVRHFPDASHWAMIDRADDVSAAIAAHAR